MFGLRWFIPEALVTGIKFYYIFSTLYQFNIKLYGTKESRLHLAATAHFIREAVKF